MKIKFKILSCILLLFMFSYYGLAIGVSPGTANFNFEPNRVVSNTLTVYNNDNIDFNSEILVQGDLSEYITLDTNELSFLSSDDKKSFSYSLKMPESFDTPGIKAGTIKIKEVIKSDSLNEVNIKPSIGVISEIFMHVPYPGKYIETSISSSSSVDWQDVVFYVKLFNLGEDDVDDLSVQLNVLGNDGQTLKQITSDSISLKSKHSGELILRMSSTDLDLGKYNVEGGLFYDGKISALKSSFEVRGELIKLLSASFDNFKLGEISKFSVLLKNVGNRKVEEIYAELILEKESSDSMEVIKTYNIDLASGDVKESIGYWDTKTLDPGQYFGTLSVKYESESHEQAVSALIEKDKAEVSFKNDLTGHVTNVDNDISLDSEVDRILQLNRLLLIVLIVLVIYLIVKKRKSSK